MVGSKETSGIIIKLHMVELRLQIKVKKRGIEMQDVKNKQGEVLGSYELTDVTKADTYGVMVVNKDGQEETLTKVVTKEDILKLASQQFNTNVRNYVAGLAREKKDTKTALLKEYIKSQGIDITLPIEDLKKTLGM